MLMDEFCFAHFYAERVLSLRYLATTINTLAHLSSPSLLLMRGRFMLHVLPSGHQIESGHIHTQPIGRFPSHFSTEHVPEGRNICMRAQVSSRTIMLDISQLEHDWAAELREG